MKNKLVLPKGKSAEFRLGYISGALAALADERRRLDTIQEGVNSILNLDRRITRGKNRG